MVLNGLKARNGSLVERLAIRAYFVMQDRTVAQLLLVRHVEGVVEVVVGTEVQLQAEALKPRTNVGHGTAGA